MGRKVRGHERPARLGAGRGLGGLFEPIPAGAGGGSSAGSSHAHLCKARGPCTQLVEEEKRLRLALIRRQVEEEDEE